MPRWVTVPEAARLLGVTERTVWRHIQRGRRAAKITDNTRYVLLTDQDLDRDPPETSPDPDRDMAMIAIREEKDKRIDALEQQLAAFQREIQELHKRLEEANESRTRSDAIIMQLSQQLDRAHLQLEDLRKHRTVWQRLKAVFMGEVG